MADRTLECTKTKDIQLLNILAAWCMLLLTIRKSCDGIFGRQRVIPVWFEIFWKRKILDLPQADCALYSLSGSSCWKRKPFIPLCFLRLKLDAWKQRLPRDKEAIAQPASERFEKAGAFLGSVEQRDTCSFVLWGSCLSRVSSGVVLNAWHKNTKTRLCRFRSRFHRCSFKNTKTHDDVTTGQHLGVKNNEQSTVRNQSTLRRGCQFAVLDARWRNSLWYKLFERQLCKKMFVFVEGHGAFRTNRFWSGSTKEGTHNLVGQKCFPIKCWKYIWFPSCRWTSQNCLRTFARGCVLSGLGGLHTNTKQNCFSRTLRSQNLLYVLALW